MKTLESRWGVEEGKRFIDALVYEARSGNGYRIEESPFGRTESGLWDFRGLQVPRETQLRRVSFCPGDYSGSAWSRVWIERSTFEGSVFDDARFLSATDHGNSVSNCRFLRASFRNAGIGYRGSRYSACSFERVDFRGAGFIRPEFDDCTFVDCRLDGSDFNGASFERCSFSGEVTDVWFRGGFWSSYSLQEFGQPRKNRMQGVSFENACLRGATFSDGCNLETVTPPRDGRHALITGWMEKLLRLGEEIEAWPASTRAEAKLFVQVHQTHARTQGHFILHRDDIEEDYGVEIAELIWNSITKP